MIEVDEIIFHEPEIDDSLMHCPVTDENLDARPGWHRHKCDCGFLWEHPDTMAGNDDAHECPKCGNMVFRRWLGKFCDCLTDCQRKVRKAMDTLAMILGF